MFNLCVIPARGGSKRIPRKNIRPFHGRPIIEYAIEKAKSSNIFDLILVSTDDPEIQRVAIQAGASAPFLRPEHLSNDFCGTNDVVKHAIEWCHQEKINVDNVCCLYSTTPLIPKDYIHIGYETLLAKSPHYVVTVVEFSTPVFRALKRNDQNKVWPAFPDKFKGRSQDFETLYHDAGQFYWGQADAFLNNLPFFDLNTCGIVVPANLAHDIDTLDDWDRVEKLYQLQLLKDKELLV